MALAIVRLTISSFKLKLYCNYYLSCTQAVQAVLLSFHKRTKRNSRSSLKIPNALLYARRIMTAQRTKTCSFIEKRHNADCGLDKLFYTHKAWLPYAYCILVRQAACRVVTPYNDEYVILL